MVIRRAATSALVGSFLAAGATTEADYFGTIQWAQRLLPGQLYAEASTAILSPGVTSVSASDIYSASATPRIDSILTFEQSLLLVWPHIVILVALTIGCFALAYARFMRQEVRA